MELEAVIVTRARLSRAEYLKFRAATVSEGRNVVDVLGEMIREYLANHPEPKAKGQNRIKLAHTIGQGKKT